MIFLFVFLFLLGMFICISLHVSLVLILYRPVHVQSSVYSCIYVNFEKYYFQYMKSSAGVFSVRPVLMQVGQPEELLDRQIET